MIGTTQGCSWQGANLVLHLHIQPKARQEGYGGRHDQYIKFRIAAPPLDGKANQRLIELLAELFDVSKQSVRLLRGHESRYKTVQIVSPQKLPEWIASPGRAD